MTGFFISTTNHMPKYTKSLSTVILCAAMTSCADLSPTKEQERQELNSPPSGIVQAVKSLFNFISA